MVVPSGEVASASGYISRVAVAALSPLSSSPELNHFLTALRALFKASTWRFERYLLISVELCSKMANESSLRVPNASSKPPLGELPVPSSKQPSDENLPSMANRDKSIAPVRGSNLVAHT